MVTRMPSDELRRKDDIVVAVHGRSPCVMQHSTKSRLVNCLHLVLSSLRRLLDIERGVVNMGNLVSDCLSAAAHLVIAINETAVAIKENVITKSADRKYPI